MYLDFDQETKVAHLKWAEKKRGESPIRHQVSREVYKIQYHPLHSSQVERVHFKGKAPGWIRKYANSYGYIFEEITVDQNEGWILIDISKHKDKQKMNSILIEKAIHHLSDQIHPYFLKEKNQLKKNINTVMRNLRKRSYLFKDLGAFYASESIYGVESSLWIDSKIFPKRESNESEASFEKRIESNVEIPHLVQELISEYPEDEVEEVLLEPIPVMVEEPNPITVVVEETDQLPVLVSNQTIIVETFIEEEEELEERIEEETQKEIDEELMEEEILVSLPTIVDERHSISELPVINVVTNSKEIPLETPNSVVTVFSKSSESSTGDLIPAKIIHKKSGAYEGQLALF